MSCFCFALAFTLLSRLYRGPRHLIYSASPRRRHLLSSWCTRNNHGMDQVAGERKQASSNHRRKKVAKSLTKESRPARASARGCCSIGMVRSLGTSSFGVSRRNFRPSLDADNAIDALRCPLRTLPFVACCSPLVLAMPGWLAVFSLSPCWSRNAARFADHLGEGSSSKVCSPHIHSRPTAVHLAALLRQARVEMGRGGGRPRKRAVGVAGTGGMERRASYDSTGVSFLHSAGGGFRQPPA